MCQFELTQLITTATPGSQPQTGNHCAGENGRWAPVRVAQLRIQAFSHLGWVSANSEAEEVKLRVLLGPLPVPPLGTHWLPVLSALSSPEVAFLPGKPVPNSEDFSKDSGSASLRICLMRGWLLIDYSSILFQIKVTFEQLPSTPHHRRAGRLSGGVAEEGQLSSSSKDAAPNSALERAPACFCPVTSH